MPCEVIDRALTLRQHPKHRASWSGAVAEAIWAKVNGPRSGHIFNKSCADWSQPRDPESKRRLGFPYVAFDTPQSRTILRPLAGTLAISVMLMRHEGNEEIGAQDGRNDAKLRDS